jgi:hypothetical protein
MSKERYNQIIDEVYEYFITKTRGLNLYLAINRELIVIEGPVYNATPRLLTQDEFINKCKTDQEFSEKWGLKIEEQELSLEERLDLAKMEGPKTKDISIILDYVNSLDKRNIPTKQITLTYQNEKIEVYD